jgi:hypothetical protein
MNEFWISAVVSFVVGLPLSIYASVIVCRYITFETTLREARRIVLNLQQEWEYSWLADPIPDPESPSGRRTVFMSRDVASNRASWQLTQTGLDMKEQGHWAAAQAIDAVWRELDQIQAKFLSEAPLRAGRNASSVTEYIADWHRRLSRQRPSFWSILKPLPNPRYKHMSCVIVDEQTGDWREVEPQRDHSA